MGRPDPTKQNREGRYHQFAYHLHTIVPMGCGMQLAHVGYASDQHPRAPAAARPARQLRDRQRVQSMPPPHRFPKGDPVTMQP